MEKITTITYKAKDGKIFQSEKDCELYEASLDVDLSKCCFEYSYNSIYGMCNYNLFIIKSEAELSVVERKCDMVNFRYPDKYPAIIVVDSDNEAYVINDFIKQAGLKLVEADEN